MINRRKLLTREKGFDDRLLLFFDFLQDVIIAGDINISFASQIRQSAFYFLLHLRNRFLRGNSFQSLPLQRLVHLLLGL